MIRLHHCHQSRSMRVLWLLNELAVPFEVVVHPFDKSLRDPDYLKLSPAGRVPALEIDGMAMFESGAMTEYLCELFPGAGLGRMPGSPERAEWLSWVHFAETVSQHVANLTQQHVVLHDDAMRSPTVMKLEAARLQKCLAAIADRLSRQGTGRDYLLSSGFSAADVSVGQAVYLGQFFASIDAYPPVRDWYQRITDRPAFRASLPGPDDKVIYDRDFYPAWEVQA
ncbi:MAG: glutathione S-transferase [Oricola sp.]